MLPRLSSMPRSHAATIRLFARLHRRRSPFPSVVAPNDIMTTFVVWTMAHGLRSPSSSALNAATKGILPSGQSWNGEEVSVFVPPRINAAPSSAFFGVLPIGIGGKYRSSSPENTTSSTSLSSASIPSLSAIDETVLA